MTSARRNYVSNRRQLDVLSAGLKANPGELRLEHAFAMALKLNGDIESATKRLERLSERFPKSSHVWHALGRCVKSLETLRARSRRSIAVRSRRARQICRASGGSGEFRQERTVERVNSSCGVKPCRNI